MMTLAEDILEFWFGTVFDDRSVIAPERLKLWFGGGDEADQLIRERFGDCLTRAACGDYRSWQETPRSALALILILDQFSRNIHRGSAEAFATDSQALSLCLEGLCRGADLALPLVGRAFFYLPLEHAEDLALQERSVTLFGRLRDQALAEQRRQFESFYDYAVRHRDIIARFGRFPHRNRMLGRENSAEETEFLRQPGSSF